jgi:phosphoribosylglycinamide formyltransferase-1
MRMLTPAFVERWQGRLINVHPSLLPSYKGLHTHARAIADGVKIHGCSVHYVVAEMDAGPIIAQAAVTVRDDDTPETLGARVLEQEHVIYPLALALAAAGKLHIADNRVLGAGGEARAMVAPALP